MPFHISHHTINDCSGSACASSFAPAGNMLSGAPLTLNSLITGIEVEVSEITGVVILVA